MYLTIPGKETLLVTDFTKYTERGFLYTPYRYQGDYESIGLVSVEITQELKHERVVGKRGKWKVWKYKWSAEPIDVDTGLERLYSLATLMGANAVVDVDIDYSTKTYDAAIDSAGREVPLSPVTKTALAYTISGFAIKRLGAFRSADQIPNRGSHDP
jgi:hypothetical protein